jgi:hypothetical protein
MKFELVIEERAGGEWIAVVEGVGACGRTLSARSPGNNSPMIAAARAINLFLVHDSMLLREAGNKILQSDSVR